MADVAQELLVDVEVPLPMTFDRAADGVRRVGKLGGGIEERATAKPRQRRSSPGSRLASRAAGVRGLSSCGDRFSEPIGGEAMPVSDVLGDQALLRAVVLVERRLGDARRR